MVIRQHATTLPASPLQIYEKANGPLRLSTIFTGKPHRFQHSKSADMATALLFGYLKPWGVLLRTPAPVLLGVISGGDSYILSSYLGS